ncbi:MAG: hypothetical protein D6722_01575 [Bacteroidetes bacterium]|nr:MAG: hypothetical protein D6722_01575 [Bacteroidota bacterium]
MLRLFAPFSPPATVRPADSYLRHRQMRRFLYEAGVGIERVARAQTDRLIEAQREIGAELKGSVDKGFAEVQAGQKRIHHALIDQTEVIAEGFEGVQVILGEGLGLLHRDLGEVSDRMEHLGLVVVEQGDRLFRGLGGLKASLDMGMVSIVTQFELQRKELKQSLAYLSQLLENQQKTRAQERFRDGKQHYEYYLEHPDEAQFLTDAMEYLLESVEIYRGNPFAHLYLGHIYQEPAASFDLEQSLHHYRLCATYAKGLKHDALTGMGFFMSAWLHFLLGDREAAIRAAEQSRNYDPEGIPENYYNLARYYAGKGEATDALRHLHTAVTRFDPYYTLKADIDAEFQEIRPDLDQFFGTLRDEAAQQWEARLQAYRLALPSRL